MAGWNIFSILPRLDMSDEERDASRDRTGPLVVKDQKKKVEKIRGDYEYVPKEGYQPQKKEEKTPLVQQETTKPTQSAKQKASQVVKPAVPVVLKEETAPALKEGEHEKNQGKKKTVRIVEQKKPETEVEVSPSPDDSIPLEEYLKQRFNETLNYDFEEDKEVGAVTLTEEMKKMGVKLGHVKPDLSKKVIKKNNVGWCDR